MKKNRLIIAKCEYKDGAWHIETKCKKSRKVTYYELEDAIALGGYVNDWEGEPVKFCDFVDMMNLKFNRQQLWYRLELILYQNEVKRETGLRCLAIQKENTGNKMKQERDAIFSTQYHDRIERMNEQLEFKSITDSNAA